ncbi:hypothetical protein A616_17165 [Brevibacillus brevis X23]|nr:hypothetical protein A616_17165 [Brevibacillus brevis X23]
MNPEKMIGKLIVIKDKESHYHGHWGYIQLWDGDVYHISGGSISSSFGEVTPIFSRDQFKIPTNLELYRKLGAKIDSKGREMK